MWRRRETCLSNNGTHASIPVRSQRYASYSCFLLMSCGYLISVPPLAESFGLPSQHQQRENKHCQGPTCHRKAIQRRRAHSLTDTHPRWNAIRTTKSSSAAAAATSTSSISTSQELHHQQENLGVGNERVSDESQSFERLVALEILRETQNPTGDAPHDPHIDDDRSSFDHPAIKKDWDAASSYDDDDTTYHDNINNNNNNYDLVVDDSLQSLDAIASNDPTDKSSTMLLQRRRMVLHSLLASTMATSITTPTSTYASSTTSTVSPTDSLFTIDVSGAIPETLDISQDIIHRDEDQTQDNFETFLPIRQPQRITIQKSSVNEHSSPFPPSIGNYQVLKDLNRSNKRSSQQQHNPKAFSSTTFTKEDLIGTVVWSAALWLLAGSRSNPLVKPLANAIYSNTDGETVNNQITGIDESDTFYNTTTQNSSNPIDSWVQDRNEGLFTPLPPSFLFLLGTIFLFLGLCTDRAILFLAEGDSDISLQLAGVSLIGGASLELGRIASGEKLKTRQETDRAKRLELEFDEFAQRRLIFGQGGSVHRSEIIRAFRRYYTKYRTADDSVLSDLEIEKLLRTWNKNIINNAEGMSSAGFFKNIKINTQTEIR